MIVSASSMASVFSFGERTPRPKARCSSSAEPPPRPRTSRPPERRSRLSAILATMAGTRYGRPRARVAMRVRGGAPAAPHLQHVEPAAELVAAGPQHVQRTANATPGLDVATIVVVVTRRAG